MRFVYYIQCDISARVTERAAGGGENEVDITDGGGSERKGL